MARTIPFLRRTISSRRRAALIRPGHRMPGLLLAFSALLLFAAESLLEVLDPLSEPLADVGQLARSESENDQSDEQDDQQFREAERTHGRLLRYLSGNMTRSLPRRKVTLSASKNSRRGMAFLRLTPASPLKEAMSITSLLRRNS